MVAPIRIRKIMLTICAVFSQTGLTKPPTCVLRAASTIAPTAPIDAASVGVAMPPTLARDQCRRTARVQAKTPVLPRHAPTTQQEGRRTKRRPPTQRDKRNRRRKQRGGKQAGGKKGSGHPHPDKRPTDLLRATG